MFAGITDNEKAELPILSKFIIAQDTDSDCRGRFPSIGKLGIRSALAVPRYSSEFHLWVRHPSGSLPPYYASVSFTSAPTFYYAAPWQS